MTIEWKKVPGYANYSASTLGNVRNDKTMKNIGAKPDARGHIRVDLITDEGKRKNDRLHRLIALTFLENPERFTMVEHISHDMTDNRPQNLRYAYSVGKKQLIKNEPVKIIKKNDQEEIWKSIFLHEREIEISNCGRVRTNNHETYGSLRKDGAISVTAFL